VTENVITALAKVQAEIGGIGKTRPKDGQLSYAYRGIDAISSEAQPLFGKHGIVIVPTDTIITNTIDLTINGKPWVDVFVRVEWSVYGPGGIDDCITAATVGVGRDNSDKSLNKAATQAFKNLMLRILCIGDPQDDADQPQHQNNYTDPRPEPPAVDDPQRLEAVRVFDEIKGLMPFQRDVFNGWRDGRSVSVPALMDPDWRAKVAEQIEHLPASEVPA
jgi:hypothetical protein